MSDTTVDVAIIGAGPVGMALACELLRHGLSVSIVDKNEKTKSYSRAPVFWPRAQEALDLMGLHHLWDGHTAPMRRVHLNVYGRPAGTVKLDGGDSMHPTPMLVGQDVTERIFDEYLTRIGCPVRRGTEATNVELRHDGVRVMLKSHDGSDEFVDAAWVVGCEGTRSLVRQSAGIGWEGHQLKGLMVPIADVIAKWPLPQAEGHAYVSLTDKGYMLAIPLPGFQRIIVAVPDTTPAGEEPSATLDDIARLAAEAIGGPVELSDSPWFAVVRYGNHLAPTFRKGRALLAGDAAHSVAPLSGQGMNTGVQDAFDLGWKLAYVQKGWAADSLLDSYAEDRRAVAERLVRSTDRFFEMILEPSAMQKTLFRAAAPIGLGFERVRDIIASYYTELDVHYADSSLNDDQHRRRPGPGEHVISRPLTRWPDLTPLHLPDVLRGLHWTVMMFAGANIDGDAMAAAHQRLVGWTRQYGIERLRGLLVIARPTAGALNVVTDGVTIALDAWADLHDAYHAHGGALMLVRPDGYIALHRGDDDDAARALEQRLAAVLHPLK